MASFSRSLRRWAPPRVAALTLGAAWLIVLATFAYAAISIQPSAASIVAASGALLIAGGGFLYAWREPGRQP